MSEILNEDYWESRYSNNETLWDTGVITTPLKNYFDQLENKDLKILIPGAGNAHEAVYLHENGFKNVFVLDIAKQPLQNFQNKLPSFPVENLLHENFFEHTGKYDLIIEQTFFCALPIAMRPDYSKKMSELLKPNGKLAGVLFDANFDGGPPFGGDAAEYRQIFGPNFNFKVFERCYNSIKPRHNRELFIILSNK